MDIFEATVVEVLMVLMIFVAVWYALANWVPKGHDD
jgi:hypothetical protein